MNRKINKEVTVEDLGIIDYQEAWDYQESLLAACVQRKIANRKKEQEGLDTDFTFNMLLLCEHPHVYTLGKSGNENNLLIREHLLKHKQAAFYKINRGGDITYHGPGQLVVYPILDLENFFNDIHKYLRLLEEVIIKFCEGYGLEAGRIEGLTGVWIDPFSNNPRKISAIGVKTSRWVTMHGLAMNVNTDLRYFENIVPCGIHDKAVTSLQKELGKTMDINRVKQEVLEIFERVFGFNYK